jgi:hypothetical protein
LTGSGAKTSHVKERQAERLVFSELLKLGLLPYRSGGGCIRVNTSVGCRLELRAVPSAETGNGRCFTVADFQPRPELFFLSVEFDGEVLAQVWVLPSIAFYEYSDDGKGGQQELSLDVQRERYSGKTFREYNSIFRNRWDPIIQFDYLRKYMLPMNAPGFQRAWEDFEDILMLMEFSELRDRDRESGEPFEPADPAADYGRPLIELSPRAQENLGSIPLDDRDEVQEAISSLADNPHPSGSIGLQGKPGNYRVRRIP